jgi:hypothetical protein
MGFFGTIEFFHRHKYRFAGSPSEAGNIKATSNNACFLKDSVHKLLIL